VDVSHVSVVVICNAAFGKSRASNALKYISSIHAQNAKRAM